MRTPSVEASVVTLLGCALSACAFVPDLGDKGEIPSVDSYAADQSLSADTMGEWPSPAWWRAFADEQLESLIEEGLRDSPTMVVARARVLRAQGLTQVAGAALQPNVALGATAAYAKPSYNTGLPTPPALHGWNDSGRIGYEAAFALDFWCGNRSALAAAIGEHRATEADMAATRLLLTSAIADAYAQLSALYADRDVLERTLEVREQTLHLVQRRYQYGYD